jgi:hypothetical protein
VAKDEASVYEGGATRPWFKSTGRPTSGPLAAWNLIGLLTPKPGSGPCLDRHGVRRVRVGLVGGGSHIRR